MIIIVSKELYVLVAWADSLQLLEFVLIKLLADSILFIILQQHGINQTASASMDTTWVVTLLVVAVI